jgi:hypothetical protein
MLSKLVSFDSVNQAKLMGEGASIIAPVTHIYEPNKTPLKKYEIHRGENSR